jgi:hypothetical protein
MKGTLMPLAAFVQENGSIRLFSQMVQRINLPQVMVIINKLLVEKQKQFFAFLSAELNTQEAPVHIGGIGI